jgi:hypothetical protein
MAPLSPGGRGEKRNDFVYETDGAPLSRPVGHPLPPEERVNGAKRAHETYSGQQCASAGMTEVFVEGKLDRREQHFTVLQELS